MWKPILLSILYFSFPFFLRAQCITAPPLPDCNGSESGVVDNESLNFGMSKWYYGPPTTFNSLTLNGGTLVVCGDLTVDKFYMDSGIIYVRPGARFVIGSGIGAGVILKGNSFIYNFGTLEIQRNLSLDNGYASASKPNLLINATRTSVFTMANQYLVINNPFSWFVNKGSAHCWGIITDAMSSPGSVCLGNGSTTRMSVLINKVANAYAAPHGNACVYVNQYSQFYGQLTAYPVLHVCLGSGHTSDTGCIPFGCAPNNWGMAQVFTSCSGCAALGVLSTQFIDFSVDKNPHGTVNLSWKMNSTMPGGTFRILRSADGRRFIAIDSITASSQGQINFNSIDNDPIPGENYYMINYRDQSGAGSLNSQTMRVAIESLSIYPSPFKNKFFIQHGQADKPEKIIVTDITGRNIAAKTIHKNGITEVLLSAAIQPGIYVIHIQTSKNIIAKTIMKN